MGACEIAKCTDKSIDSPVHQADFSQTSGVFLRLHAALMLPRIKGLVLVLRGFEEWGHEARRTTTTTSHRLVQDPWTKTSSSTG